MLPPLGFLDVCLDEQRRPRFYLVCLPFWGDTLSEQVKGGYGRRDVVADVEGKMIGMVGFRWPKRICDQLIFDPLSELCESFSGGEWLPETNKIV